MTLNLSRVLPNGGMPDSYGEALIFVGRRGDKIWENTNMPMALAVMNPRKSRIGMYS